MNTTARWDVRKTELSVTSQLNSIKNHLWLDSERNWNLSPNFIDVYGIGIEKRQQIGRFFSIRGKVLYQKTNDTIVDLPLFATSSTVLFQTPLYFKSTKGRATLNVGVDCWFNTQYYIPDFDPALNQFFTQRLLKLGDYPFVDIFISARIKRMVLLLRLEHINAGMQGTTYFDAYNYPSRPFNVKMGLSWTFYD